MYTILEGHSDRRKIVIVGKMLLIMRKGLSCLLLVMVKLGMLRGKVESRCCRCLEETMYLIIRLYCTRRIPKY